MAPQPLVTNPHNQFFGELIKDPRVAREFLKRHLPSDIYALINFNYFELQPRSQSNAVRRESIVDLLFKTYIANKESYVYFLLEHQSTPDPLMALRVIEYTINAVRDHIKKHKTTNIPFIFPLVIYHGRPYKFKQDINDLVDAPKDLVVRYFLKPFQLIDLNKIKDDELKQQMWSGVMEFALKHIFDRDILPHLPIIQPVLKKIIQEGGSDIVGIMLQYIVDSGEVSDNNALIEFINTKVSHELGEKIMTAAEKWRQEGMLEGQRKGMLEGTHIGKVEIIKTMLSNGVEPAFIAKNTGVSIQEVKKLQKQIENK